MKHLQTGPSSLGGEAPTGRNAAWQDRLNWTSGILVVGSEIQGSKPVCQTRRKGREGN